jgi:hypothetical protein
MTSITTSPPPAPTSADRPTIDRQSDGYLIGAGVGGVLVTALVVALGREDWRGSSLR